MNFQCGIVEEMLTSSHIVICLGQFLVHSFHVKGTLGILPRATGPSGSYLPNTSRGLGCSIFVVVVVVVYKLTIHVQIEKLLGREAAFSEPLASKN